MARLRILPTPGLAGPSGRPPEPWRPGPLAGRYPAAAAMVVLFLVPYLGLSSALPSVTPIIAGQLHMSPQLISLGSGMANAGYAAGTVLAVQFAQHLPQRRMLLLYAALLLIGSVLAAAATGPAMFITGHVLQGLCTSLLLIAAAPPLFLGYPADKLRWSAMIMNMCLFGAVTAGPLVGGAQASFHAWRPLFWIVAGIAAAGLVMSLLTFTDAPPADRSAPRDPTAIGLAAVGSVAAFWGAAELTTHRFLDPVAVVPLLGGLALIIVLWVYQYRARNPLLTLRSLNTTIPVTGIVVAICAAAAATSALALTGTVLAPHYPPLHLGLLYIPELGAAVITSVVFGAVFSTRLIHVFALAGMVFLAAGIALLRGAIPPTSALTLVGSGLVGVGIGASVAPALFLAGFSLRSASIQRVFAVLELLRAVAAFMVAPILLHFATTVTGLPTAAMSTALWICFGLSAGGAIVGVALYLLGGVRPSAPSLGPWMDGDEPAWESPPLLAAVRRASPARVLGGRLSTALPGRVLGERLSTALPGRNSGTGLAASRTGRSRRRQAGERDDRSGPIVFGYDGSDLAKAAITEAGRQLPAHRDALVLTVWRTYNVEFTPQPGTQFDAARADEVKEAAEQTAAHGAALAETAGFRAQGLAVEGTPTWKVIADAADDHDASLIVLGSRGHAGLGGRVAGSVAHAVASHTPRPVLIVQDHHEADRNADLPRRDPGLSGLTSPGPRTPLSRARTTARSASMEFPVYGPQSAEAVIIQNGPWSHIVLNTYPSLAGDASPLPSRPARLTYADVMPGPQNAVAPAIERPVRRRRRGTAVENAISDAVIAELADVGFGRLTFEGVAERAGTGKSPLYRRWPDTTSLVIDTLEKLGSDPAEYARTGVLRDDLIGLTLHMIKAQKGVRGDAYRSLLGEAHRHPELLARFKSQVFDPRFAALTDLLCDAARRGEISPDRLTPVVLEVLHALIIKRTLLDTQDPTKKDIAEMVDQVLLPLLGYQT